MSEATQTNLSNQQQETIPPSAEADPFSAEFVSLDSCKPTGSSPNQSNQTAGHTIHPAPRDEIFTPVGKHVTIMCYIHRKQDAQGYYVGEDYYPVTSALQSKVSLPLRSVAFHPCISHDGQAFIYPQKKDIPGRRPNSWNESLASALNHAPGQWLKIWSDAFTERYQHELVPPPMENLPEYTDFQSDLEKALKPNIIDRLDHPILMKAQQGSDAGDEEEIY
jgi:hypothetical protein